MTFLELVKALRSRVGMQGSGPASVTDATSAELDLVNSVSDAWVDIQNFREDWRWMRATKSFLLTPSVSTYTITTILSPTNRFKKWLVGTAFVSDNGGKKTPIRFIHYDNFIYKNINSTTPNKVSEFTIVPWNNALMFNLPDSAYTITIDYQKSPQLLLSNSEVPELPESFHLLILYAAVEKYCVVVNSQSIYQQYAIQHAIMMGQLMRSQLEKKKIIVEGIV